MTNSTPLDELFALMTADDSSVLDKHGQWRGDLPTFGGDEPNDTSEIWSWDNTRLIVGTCNNDLEIINRNEWNA